MNIGITLSGGGSRGLAHLGVLQALSERGVRPTRIIGTSAGAIMGVMYAAGYSIEEIKKISAQNHLFKIFKLWFPIKGITDQSYLNKLLDKHIGTDDFENLDIPFEVGVTNLIEGRHQLLDSGSLFKAVMASSAIPGIFEPVKIDEYLYVDGGITNNMPAQALESNCSIIIGSNVVSQIKRSVKELGNIKNIIARSFEVSLHYRSRIDEQCCDILFEPPGLMDYPVFDFSKADEIMNVGYEHALAMMQSDVWIQKIEKAL